MQMNEMDRSIIIRVVILTMVFVLVTVRAKGNSSSTVFAVADSFTATKGEFSFWIGVFCVCVWYCSTNYDYRVVMLEEYFYQNNLVT